MMGHTITARNPGQLKPFAELRINGRRRRETKLYTALNVDGFNKQDSGSGDTAIFPAWKLKKLSKDVFLHPDERDFLNKCSATGSEAIEITFA